MQVRWSGIPISFNLYSNAILVNDYTYNFKMQYSFKRDKGVGIHIQVGRGQDSLIFTFQIYNSLELAQIEKSPNNKTYIG